MNSRAAVWSRQDRPCRESSRPRIPIGWSIARRNGARRRAAPFSSASSFIPCGQSMGNLRGGVWQKNHYRERDVFGEQQLLRVSNFVSHEDVGEHIAFQLEVPPKCRELRWIAMTNIAGESRLSRETRNNVYGPNGENKNCYLTQSHLQLHWPHLKYSVNGARVTPQLMIPAIERNEYAPRSRMRRPNKESALKREERTFRTSRKT